MGKKILATVIAAAAAVGLTLCVILTALECVAFDPEFYREQYELGDQASIIGMTDEDLMSVTVGLLDYLRDDREALDMRCPVNGGEREVFTEKEQLHMADVKALFDIGYKIRAAGLVLGIAGFLTVILLEKKQGVRRYGKGLIFALILMTAALTALGIAVAIDFNKVFIAFHHLVFTNDLWLLDPAESILINMVPETFFSAITVRIGIAMGIGLLALLVLALILLRCGKKQGKKSIKS